MQNKTLISALYSTESKSEEIIISSKFKHKNNVTYQLMIVLNFCNKISDTWCL